MQSDHFFNPANVGDVDEPTFAGSAASFECGATIRVSLQIDDNQRISNARFRAAGCSSLVAAASFLTTAVKGETTAEAASLAQHPDRIEQEFGPALPDERQICVTLACNALLAAIANYSDSVRDEWVGDDALICTCFGVSERTIEGAIRADSLHSIEDVTRACNAGAGCRSCYPLIQEILDSNFQTIHESTPK